MTVSNYLAELNEKQKMAVVFPVDKPLKIVAGAGTGKTRVLTTRYIHILASDQACRPENILTMTFTEKAAQEMKVRIINLCREVDVVNKLLTPQNIWISTFHAFCQRILKEHALLAGLDPEFSVCDEVQSRLLYQRVVRQYLREKLNLLPVVNVTEQRFYEEDIYDLIGRLKDDFHYPDIFSAQAEERREAYYARWQHLFAELDILDLHHATRKAIRRQEQQIEYQAEWEKDLLKIIYELFIAYQNALAAANALDFADLIYYTYRLLAGNPRLLQSSRQRFRYILVDEFQDTNRAQYNLLCLLAKDEKMSNVTIVGDVKQAIYGWRNARAENMQDFAAKKWGGGEIELDINYRSYQEILDTARFTIIQDPSVAPEEGNKQLLANRGSAKGACVFLYLAADRQQEARALARTIKELLEKGVPAREIVILLRSPRRAKPYEDALREQQVVYKTIGGVGFYDREEIKDLLAYLRVLNNPYDSYALVRVLQGAPWFCDDAELYQLGQLQLQEGQGNEKPVYLYDTLQKNKFGNPHSLPISLREKLQHFSDLFAELQLLRENLSLCELLQLVLESTGYLNYVYTQQPFEVRRRVANIKKLFDLAQEFDSTGEPVTLDDFVAFTDFALECNLREGEGNFGTEDAVCLLSVHQAKGLEFAHVFLANVSEKSFPVQVRYRNLDFSEKTGLVFKRDPQGNTFAKFEPHNYERNNYREIYERYGINSYKAEQREKQQKEERRLFYVALTRAKEAIYIGCPALFPERNRGPHFFQEMWDTLGDQPWLQRNDCLSAEEVQSIDSCVHIWDRRDVESYGEALYNWQQQQFRMPVSEVRKLISLSVTSVAMYRRCPRAYFLRYQLGLKEQEAGVTGRVSSYNPLLLGQLVHLFLEAYHRESIKKSDAEELLQLHAKTLQINQPQYEETLAAARIILRQYLTGPLAEMVPAEMEFDFNLILENEEREAELSGKIDCINRDEKNRWQIIDYKTNRYITPVQWEDYSLQLRLYALAFKKLFPDRGDASLYVYHLPAGRLLEVENNTRQLKTARDMVLQTAAAIARRYYPSQQGEHCHLCAYRRYCH